MLSSARRNLFSCLLCLIVLPTFLAGFVAASPDPITVYVDPAIIADKTKTVGSTFSINVTAAGVNDLFAFQFRLTYNTTMLTATNYSVYDPFTTAWPSQINDTGGFVAVAHTMPLGTPVGGGVSGTVPLARIDFTVDALGVTLLNLPPPPALKLNTPVTSMIIDEIVGGSFSNINVHDVSIASVVANPRRVAASGDPIPFSVTIVNKGDFDETFNVTTRFSGGWIENKTYIFLASRENTTLSFTWDTTGGCFR